MEIQSIKKYADRFDEKAQYYLLKYQETGNSSTLKTKEKYEDLFDICQLALKEQLDVDEDRARRIRNIRSFQENNLAKENYIKEEVKVILTKISYF